MQADFKQPGFKGTPLFKPVLSGHHLEKRLIRQIFGTREIVHKTVDKKEQAVAVQLHEFFKGSHVPFPESAVANRTGIHRQPPSSFFLHLLGERNHSYTPFV